MVITMSNMVEFSPLVGRKSLDTLVRQRLQSWPQRPPGTPSSRGRGTWLRGRPSVDLFAHPYLKIPGASSMRTVPDGLWLNFGTDPDDPYVDILCIEACSTLQNLLDKRSRFAPSTTSLMACCPLPWLLAPFQPPDPTPRWRVIRLLRAEPTAPVNVPVRDVRVLYGLKSQQYDGFARCQVPQGHEYFCPMDVLTAEAGHENPDLRSLLARASASSAFMHPV